MLQVDNDPIILGPCSPLSAAPLTGVTAPTTSTPGYLGQVVFDTNGNRWELKYIDGTTYYWSPEYFPAVNTEYFSHYDNALSKIVYKYRQSANSVATGATTTVNIIGVKKLLSAIGSIQNSAVYTVPIPMFINSALTQQCGWIPTLNANTITYVLTHPCGVGKELILDFVYIK